MSFTMLKDAFSGIAFREVTPTDEVQLLALWSSVFGDPSELAKSFLLLLPEMGTGCLAEMSGTILGAAYLIDDFTLLQPGGPPLRCGYLYAVAVTESARGLGIGAALSRRAAELGRRRGIERLCTLPAEASLYAWYERTLDLRFQCTRLHFSAESLSPSRPLAASEYLTRREAILAHQPHVVPGIAAMEFQKLLCRTYGGDLYCGDLSGTGGDETIFCAYRDQDIWVIPELLPLPAGGSFPGLRGEVLPYLTSDLPLPDGALWNLTFD